MNIRTKKYLIVSAALAVGFLLPITSLAQGSAVPLAVSPTTTVNPLPLLCYDFHNNMKVGAKGDQIRRLQFFLLDLSYNIPPEEYGVFGENTRLAIKSFQEKYRDEILTPLKLTEGNGIVNRMTRAKLNSIYGCQAVNQLLLISGLDLSISGTSLDSTGLSVTFCNRGSSSVPTFPVRIRLNGINRDFDILGAKAAGVCETDTFSYNTWGLSYDPGSTFTAVTIIDPLGIYKKSGINFPVGLETTVTVPVVNGIHLAVRSLILKSNGVQATFCNQGTNDLTNFPVRVTVNGNAKDLDIPGAYKKATCVPITWPYSTWGLVNTPGTIFSVNVYTDPNNIYNEVNEFDNSAAVVGT